MKIMMSYNTLVPLWPRWEAPSHLNPKPVLAAFTLVLHLWDLYPQLRGLPQQLCQEVMMSYI